MQKQNTTHCKSSLAFRENEPTAVMASENEKHIWMSVNIFCFSFSCRAGARYLLWLLNPDRGAQTSASTATCLSLHLGDTAEPQSRCIDRTGGGDVGAGSQVTGSETGEVEVERLNTSAGG